MNLKHYAENFKSLVQKSMDYDLGQASLNFSNIRLLSGYLGPGGAERVDYKLAQGNLGEILEIS